MKKLIKTWHLLVPFWALFFFTACQEERDVIKPAKTDKTCLINRITYAGSDVITYHYDNQNRLQHADYTGHILNNENYIKQYEYDAAGRISKEIFKNTAGHTYSYFSFAYNESNLVSKISFYHKPAGSSTFTHEYDKEMVYTGGNRIAKVTTLRPGHNQGSRYDIYIYNAANNIIKIIENAVNGAVVTNDVTTEYTYDNKINPYLNAAHLGIGAATHSKNNIVTEKVTYHLSGQIKNYTSTYEYNHKGYPVKQTQVSDNHLLEIVRDYNCTD